MTEKRFGRLCRQLAGLGLLLMVGCAGLNQAVSQQQALTSIDTTVQKYNRSMRWRETDHAADLVVDEKRNQFTRQAEALKEVFGSHAASLAISSTKSLTGHCLAGALLAPLGIAFVVLVRLGIILLPLSYPFRVP